MNKNKKIVLVIAVIGSLACLLSFSISLSKNNNSTASIIFGLAGLFCISTAIGLIKYK